MAIDLLLSCGCAFLAKPTIQARGPWSPISNGKIAAAAGETIRVGDLVVYSTSTDTWSKLGTGASLTNASRIGLVVDLKDTANNETYGEKAIDSAFNGAKIVSTGGPHIKCSDAYLWNGSARVAYAPETHTLLNDKVTVIPYNDIDGTQVYWFTFQ